MLGSTSLAKGRGVFTNLSQVSGASLGGLFGSTFGELEMGFFGSELFTSPKLFST